jgi:hypothetical protein
LQASDALNGTRWAIRAQSWANIMRTKDDEARDLAQKHYEIEPGLMDVFRITGAPDVEARPGEPIKLLEVNETTVPSGIMPIQFGPSPASGLHYSSVIVEVTPEEYTKIRSAELALPDGWKVGDRIPRSPAPLNP